MHRSTTPTRPMLLAAIVLSLSLPAVAQAQQPARETVPFKATLAGPADVVIVPIDPPVGSARLNIKGISDLLGGATTWLDLHIGHLGVDGSFLRVTDGHGAMTGPTGDGLFVQWSGVARPTDKAGLFALTGSFTVSGGRGRFLGATGSGILTATINLATLEVAYTWDGQVLLPKK